MGTSPQASAYASCGNDKVEFGKLRGLSFSEALAQDPRYCEWIKKEATKDDAGENLRAFAAFIKSQAVVRDDVQQKRQPARPATDAAEEPSIASGQLKLNFGKYSDLSFEEVYATDSNYCDWLVRRVLGDGGQQSKVKSLKFVVYILYRRSMGASSTRVTTE